MEDFSGFSIIFFFLCLQQALTKVPTNVQHFADLGVYKQLKKKTHLTKDGLFPHLPGHPETDTRKVKIKMSLKITFFSTIFYPRFSRLQPITIIITAPITTI